MARSKRDRSDEFDASMGDLLANASVDADVDSKADAAQSSAQAAGAEKAGWAATPAAGGSGRGRKKVVVPDEPFVYPVDPRHCLVCGVDEAGRGPLMGDVVAACVILDHNNMIEGLNDSKKLTEKARDALAPVIKEQAVAWGIGRASPQEIDELNILNATFLAMRRAYDAMARSCNLVLVDGNRVPATISSLGVMVETVVKGDSRVPEISAASILAKTARDADLYELDKIYPEYGFAAHKGYPTKAHLEILATLPILDCYRRSYGPVARLLAERGRS